MSKAVDAIEEVSKFVEELIKLDETWNLINEKKEKTPFTKLSPQCRKILTHCMKQGSISPDEAITYYRIMSLPRRILDLKENGYEFNAERRRHPVSGQQYKRYFLVEDED